MRAGVRGWRITHNPVGWVLAPTIRAQVVGADCRWWVLIIAKRHGNRRMRPGAKGTGVEAGHIGRDQFPLVNAQVTRSTSCKLLPTHLRGLHPLIRKNSRLKFDFVLKPDDNMAEVTLSPANKAACAALIRALLT